MQEPMRVGREQLATLLWPERIDRQARQNLRACLASLRNDLAGFADDALAIDAESVGIKAMRVDARELRALGEANAAGEIEDAASLYRGPFLSDLALEGEAFYAWASAERANSMPTRGRCFRCWSAVPRTPAMREGLPRWRRGLSRSIHSARTG